MVSGSSSFSAESSASIMVSSRFFVSVSETVFLEEAFFLFVLSEVLSVVPASGDSEDETVPVASWEEVVGSVFSVSTEVRVSSEEDSSDWDGGDGASVAGMSEAE